MREKRPALGVVSAPAHGFVRRAIVTMLSTGLPTNFDQSDTRVTNQGKATIVHRADPDERLPIVVCPMNTHGHVDRFEGRVSPGGRAYFWAAAGGMDFQNTEPGSDVDWLFRRAITVTPLRYDLTDEPGVERWAGRAGSHPFVDNTIP